MIMCTHVLCSFSYYYRETGIITKTMVSYYYIIIIVFVCLSLLMVLFLAVREGSQYSFIFHNSMETPMNYSLEVINN